MNDRFVKIGEAAKILGVNPQTLRRWEEGGVIEPAKRTPKGTRLYSLQELLGVNDLAYPTIAYARVSSSDQMSRLVITHKDRLLRFGAEIVFRICELKGIEVVIINKGEQPSFEEELTRDVMEIMTVFCAKLYGRRSHKSKKMAEEIENIVSEAEQRRKGNPCNL